MAPQTVPLSEIAKAGDHRSLLKALLYELCEGMEQAPPTVKPQYAARIQDVSAELDSLPNAEPTQVDDLVDRRKARRDASNAAMRAKQLGG
jgi:hypothetical protein